jgi:hypothetical protein
MLKFFGKTAGAMWIDEKDKQVARLEASLAGQFQCRWRSRCEIEEGSVVHARTGKDQR